MTLKVFCKFLCFLVLLCTVSSENQVLKRIACRNESISLECKSIDSLEILNAVYGKQSSHICPVNSQISTNVNCNPTSVTEEMKKLCAGANTCTIDLKTTSFSDNCPETENTYLEVQYRCQSLLLTTTTPKSDVINHHGPRHDDENTKKPKIRTPPPTTTTAKPQAQPSYVHAPIIHPYPNYNYFPQPQMNYNNLPLFSAPLFGGLAAGSVAMLPAFAFGKK